jgi:hypothetical protein
MPVTKKTTLAALMLALPLLVAGLSACSAPATEAAPTVSTPSGGEQRSYDSFEEYQLALFACLRDEGIDVNDPSGGGQNITRSDDAFQEAIETCQVELGPPPAQEGAGGGSDTADSLRDEQLRIAQCLRDQGVEVADPAPGGDLEIPRDVPSAAFETCAPNGVAGTTGGGQ